MTEPKVETLEILENGNISSPKSKKKKQCTQLLKWFFTFNNYTVKDIEIIETCFKAICIKYVFQEEIGDKRGTPHLQGNIWLKKKMRPSEFKLDKRMWWEATRNEEAAASYCAKSETSKEGSTPHKWGWPKPLKCIEILYPWQEKILDLCKTEPDDRSVHWYWEEVGKIGKSQFVRYMVIKHKILFCNGGKRSDIINLVFNNNMDTCDCIMWDIPRCAEGSVSYAAIEEIKNGLVCNTKYETGTKVFNPPHVICFANFPPRNIDHFSADRWVITYLGTNKNMDNYGNLINDLDEGVNTGTD